jgi:hypothetical protein
MTHSEAVKMVNGKTSRQSRKVGNNTYAEILPNGSVGIMLHSTYVVTIHEDNTYTLRNGGWYSPTTKDRMNKYLPAGVSVIQRKGEWYVKKTIRDFANVIPYEEGVTVQ